MLHRHIDIEIIFKSMNIYADKVIKEKKISESVGSKRRKSL